MALDTSIPLRAVQGMYNPAETVQQAASLRDMVQQQQLRGLQIQDAVDARQRRTRLSDLLTNAADPETGQLDYTKVRSAYAQVGDIEGVAQAEDMLAKMDEQQRAQARERAGILGAAAQSLRSMPYEQRRAALAQMAPTLEPLGLTAQQLQAFDPTDAAIDGIAAQVLGLKGVLEQQNSDRTYELDVKKFGETTRSNAAKERMERLKLARQGSGMPKPPPGYRYTADNNLEAIPGGPAAQKAEVAAQKAGQSRQAREAKVESIVSTIDQAIPLVDGWFAAGIGSGMSSAVGGTAGANLEALLGTIKANLGFEELQAMREASPTGGALGQVAVQELQALQSTVAALDRSQSDEQLKGNLMKARQHYQNWLNAVRQAESSGGAPSPQRASDNDPLGLR